MCDLTVHEFVEPITEEKTLLPQSCENLSKIVNDFLISFDFRFSFSFIGRRLPEYKQRIAGKSIPFEKFSIHKANKYLAQNHRLFLPGMVCE